MFSARSIVYIIDERSMILLGRKDRKAGRRDGVGESLWRDRVARRGEVANLGPIIWGGVAWWRGVGRAGVVRRGPRRGGEARWSRKKRGHNRTQVKLKVILSQVLPRKIMK